MQLTTGQRQFLDSLHADRLYVKFFDVDWDPESKMPVPMAEVVMQEDTLKDLEIVPTVFITNRVFVNMSRSRTEWLAGRIHEKLSGLSGLSYKEIQFDCDWTQTTKDSYFLFLEAFRNLLPDSGLQLSATIRLHQYKYPGKTGVPPVDRGMLMVYNTGELERWETDNSILDLQAVGQYLDDGRSYPLPLDLALPIFRWGVLFRNGELTYLMHDLEPADLQDTAYFHEVGTNRFEVLKSTYLHGYYVYSGDQIRLEATQAELLERTVQLLSDKLSDQRVAGGRQRYMAFYHLDSAAVKVFDHEKIQGILRAF